jgi:hypothetical protein
MVTQSAPRKQTAAPLPAGSDSEDSSSRARNHKAAARAAVANSLDTFSEEFLSWATATGTGLGHAPAT